MSECCIKFSEPVSRGTISQLVIEYMKYILYYRGQFPLPLDQLILAIEKRDKSAAQAEIDEHPVYYDEGPRPNTSKDRTKRIFEDTINSFSNFFNQLSTLLQSKDVLEVVMNLGSNMMNPKELHRITLPTRPCSDSDCRQNSAPFHRCRLQFFKTIMHENLLSDFSSDSLLPISVLLLLRTGTEIMDFMEQKRFYAPPMKGKQVTVRFDDSCNHLVIDDDSTESNSSGLWVKLKHDLKGFKAYKSFSNCS
ncbi:hypothetical protein JTE90_028461 [Oedothorax gibbosus]|uniref:Uncharacterized protein n=1 Tax=Oedothorax gibbosus TaxID=931172 RepID=A0AAV6VFC7_9ARAC|nr:hypothetical protein JTE90_028461 [Oedothorax gibbosus]